MSFHKVIDRYGVIAGYAFRNSDGSIDSYRDRQEAVDELRYNKDFEVFRHDGKEYLRFSDGGGKFGEDIAYSEIEKRRNLPKNTQPQSNAGKSIDKVSPVTTAKPDKAEITTVKAITESDDDKLERIRLGLQAKLEDDIIILISDIETEKNKGVRILQACKFGKTASIFIYNKFREYGVKYDDLPAEQGEAEDTSTLISVLAEITKRLHNEADKSIMSSNGGEGCGEQQTDDRPFCGLSGTGVNNQIPPMSEEAQEEHRKHIEKCGCFRGMPMVVYVSKGVKLARKAVGDDVLGYKANDGTIVRYNVKANEWVRASERGVITYFKPSTGIDYYERWLEEDGE